MAMAGECGLRQCARSHRSFLTIALVRGARSLPESAGRVDSDDGDDSSSAHSHGSRRQSRRGEQGGCARHKPNDAKHNRAKGGRGCPCHPVTVLFPFFYFSHRSCTLFAFFTSTLPYPRSCTHSHSHTHPLHSTLSTLHHISSTLVDRLFVSINTAPLVKQRPAPPQRQCHTPSPTKATLATTRVAPLDPAATTTSSHHLSVQSRTTQEYPWLQHTLSRLRGAQRHDSSRPHNSHLAHLHSICCPSWTMASCLTLVHLSQGEWLSLTRQGREKL